MDYPKIRPVDVFPVALKESHLHADGFALRDPSGVIESTLMVTRPALFLLSLMDGHHSVKDIQVEGTRKLGTLVMSHQIEKLVAQMDENYFLESERFQSYLQKQKDDFAALSIRPAFHAGKAYPADKNELNGFLDGIFQRAEKELHEENDIPDGKLSGIISPHIDYMRGGLSYPLAYRPLLNRSRPGRFVIFGTSHYVSQPLFMFCKKDFETPLGIVKTDRAFIQTVEKDTGMNLCENEFAHRAEHSVELQAVMLKYLYSDQPLKIVPVLCGHIPENKQGFLKVMEGIKKHSGPEKDTLFVAGADFSHVGRRFGDKPIPAEALKLIKVKDMETVSFVEAFQAEAFFENVMGDGNARHICGVSPVYFLMKALERQTLDGQKPPAGKLFFYDQWFDPGEGSAVTFASMGVYSHES